MEFGAGELRPSLDPPEPRSLREKARIKSWQYMTAVTDDMFIAFAVGTAGFASNGFVYATELPGARVHKRFAIVPLRLGTTLAPSSTAGTHRFATRALSIAIDNRGRDYVARIDARTDSGEHLLADLAFDSKASDEHLALAVPLASPHWNYTHKFAAFGVAGHVTIGDRRIDFPHERSYGTMDFTKSYALRHAVWRWIAVAGKTTTGSTFGINLVDPTPNAPVSENALWLDGKRHALEGVSIAHDMRSARASGLELSIEDIADVKQRLDVPLVGHRLRHVVGKFSGRITIAGAPQIIDAAVGIAEDFDTWW